MSAKKEEPASHSGPSEPSDPIPHAPPVSRASRGNRNSKHPRKGDIARKKILKAAREVFSKHPYHSASIRMVGKEGGFDHPLIHYYFPSKQKLFEAVASELFDEFFEFEKTWYEGLADLSLSESIAVFIDRVLAFHFNAPEVFRVIMQNTAHIDRLEDLPGVDYYLKYYSRMYQSLRRQVQLDAPEVEIERYIYSFNVLLNNFLGAGTTYAQILNMAPDSREYFEWVKKTLVALYVPFLKKLLFPEKDPPRESK